MIRTAGYRGSAVLQNMGWTFIYKSPDKKPRELLTEIFTWEGKNGVYHRVLDCAVVHFQEAYLAIESGDAAGPKEVFAAICLIQHNHHDYYNFGYKDMDETEHPYYYNCPERILKKLTPTNSELAQEWRNKCWERIRARKERPRFRTGKVVRFEKPITFRNGAKEDTFKVINAKRLVLEDRHGNLYKINKYTVNAIPFEVFDDFPPKPFILKPDFHPDPEDEYQLEIHSMPAERARRLVEGLRPEIREQEIKKFEKDPNWWLRCRGFLPIGHHIAVLHRKKGKYMWNKTYLASFSTKNEAEAFLKKWEVTGNEKILS